MTIGRDGALHPASRGLTRRVTGHSALTPEINLAYVFEQVPTSLFIKSPTQLPLKELKNQRQYDDINALPTTSTGSGGRGKSSG